MASHYVVDSHLNIRPNRGAIFKPPLPNRDMQDAETNVPYQSYPELFIRFLKFGLLAWGGPVAQLDLIKHELVDQEKWITKEKFNRVLAVYQLLPGPEAQEMCVYFGMLSRGRLGAIIAGLGFLLPGFFLMLLLSWIYVAYGISSPLFAAAFYGIEPAVAALIVRATHRIGADAVTNAPLLAIAAIVAITTFLNVHFVITLGFAGIAYVLEKRGQRIVALSLSLAILAGAVLLSMNGGIAASITSPAQLSTPSMLTIFIAGLDAGLLTYGGVYTAIPVLQHDAVGAGKWLTNSQFLDGLGLSAIIPAPFIIFSTFIGYLGGGLLGAVVMTIGVFLPAFAFTLVGHQQIEDAVKNKALLVFLDGVIAGVVALIGVTALTFLLEAVPDWKTAVLFLASLLALYRFNAKETVAIVVILAGLSGLALHGV